MADSLNGGRGNYLPYKVTHIRVPKPLKDSLERLVVIYKFTIMSGDQGNTNSFRSKLIEFIDNFPPNCDQLKIDFELKEKASTAISELALKSSSKTIAALEQERDILRENSKAAIALLKSSLKLRANSGGAIKQEIHKALLLIDSQES